MAAHSANNMFSLYKYLIVNLVFSHLGFWCGNFFLIAPFPDHCLLLFFELRYCSIVALANSVQTKRVPATSVS